MELELQDAGGVKQKFHSSISPSHSNVKPGVVLPGQRSVREGTSHGGSDRRDPAHQLGEEIGSERLFTVGECLRGPGVDLHH